MDEEKIKALFEKAFKDFRDGLITNDAFVKAVTELAAKTLGESLQDVDTLKKNMDTLTGEIKRLRTVQTSSDRTSLLDKLYNGVWGSAELATDFGMFVLASVAQNKSAREYLVGKGYDLDHKNKDISVDDNTTGGLFVPTQILDGIIMLIEKYGVFRQEALVVPMSSLSATAVALVSGLQVYCPAIGVVPTKSDPAFKPIGLNAKEWVTYTAIDRNLDENAAIAVGNMVGELIAMAFAQKEDEVGFVGDATEAYFGHLGITGALKKTASLKGLLTGTGVTWASLVIADFLSVQGEAPDYGDAGSGYKWYCSRKFYYTVMRKTALAASGTYAAEIMGNDTRREKTFLGDPVKFAHAMPKVTAETQICCIYGNLKLGAKLGDARKMTIEQSREALFLERQIAILGTESVAVNVEAGVGDTSNAGPILGLKTGTT